MYLDILENIRDNNLDNNFHDRLNHNRVHMSGNLSSSVLEGELWKVLVVGTDFGSHN